MAYDFSEALTLMKTGTQVFRIAWNGKPNFVEMSGPIGTPAPTNNTFIQDFPTSQHPWTPQVLDICAVDWETYVSGE